MARFTSFTSSCEGLIRFFNRDPENAINHWVSPRFENAYWNNWKHSKEFLIIMSQIIDEDKEKL